MKPVYCIGTFLLALSILFVASGISAFAGSTIERPLSIRAPGIDSSSVQQLDAPSMLISDADANYTGGGNGDLAIVVMFILFFIIIVARGLFVTMIKKRK